MSTTEIITLIANLSALSVIGFIYVAYIKNLRTINQLKDSQLSVAEQNTKLWKDRVLELERRTPEFMEKKLSERIKIREDELSRLERDTKGKENEIEKKNKEIQALKTNLDKASEYRSSFTVWDQEVMDFIEVEDSELEVVHIGSLCVDSATIVISDPMYIKGAPLKEVEEYPAVKHKYRVIGTGEQFCVDSAEEDFAAEVLGLDSEQSVNELVKSGVVEKIEYGGEIPAIATSYIRGTEYDPDYRRITHHSFPNGRVGAGISVITGADGVYPISVEQYKDEIQRIIIEL